MGELAGAFFPIFMFLSVIGIGIYFLTTTSRMAAEEICRTYYPEISYSSCWHSGIYKADRRRR